MSIGAYTTQYREVFGDPISITQGKMGAAGSTLNWATTWRGDDQTTYSFRTRGVSEEDQIANDLRITRNGFRTNDPKYDLGHPFWTCKRYASRSSQGQSFYMIGQASKTRDPIFWRGELVPRVTKNDSGWTPGNGSYGQYPEISRLSNSDIAKYGQRAINASVPTAPQANAAVFLGEVMNRLPQLAGYDLIAKNKAKDFRTYGSEYLNVVFGWVPFVNEINNIITSLNRASKVVTQLQRDNGRNIRRTFAFPETVEREELTPVYYANPFAGSQNGTFLADNPEGGYYVYRTKTIKTRLWFKGAFAYSIPMDNTILDRLRRYEAQANVLLGTRLTPDVLWELAPWSWLTDWFVGIGQAISSATRFSEDGLVIRYGYLMKHTTCEVSYTVPPVPLLQGGKTPHTTLKLTTELKERVPATPYGFGLNTDSFSGQQWAILAALGMSKAPRSLRSNT